MSTRNTLLKIASGAALTALLLSNANAKVVGPPDVAWKDMTPKQKGAYMKAVVTPKMKPIFQAFDGKQFKTFNCETCHGKGAGDRKFKMPSPDIKPLPSTPEAFQAKMKTEKDWPKWVDFMKGKGACRRCRRPSPSTGVRPEGAGPGGLRLQELPPA